MGAQASFLFKVQTKHITRIFQLYHIFDIMGGVCSISAEQQAAMLPDPWQENATREQMMEIVFDMADTDQLGALTLGEFEKLCENSDNEDVKKRMKEAFEMADQKEGGWFGIGGKKDQKLSKQEFVDFNIKHGGDDDEKFRIRAKIQYVLAKNAAKSRK